METWSPDDRYLPLRKLGEGGSAAVWLVEDRLRPGARVALKRLAAAGDPEEAFRREFATLARLRHPSLAEVYEFDRCPATGLPRFTLEHVEGDDVAAEVRRGGAPALLDLAAEALRALGFLHDFGLVHRDLKPGNLLVRSRPRLGCRLVVLDFGLALSGPAASGLAGRPAGTLPYLAPELLRGAPASRRTDLWSLGAVLFEAVHGRTPYPLDDAGITGYLESVERGMPAAPPLPPDFPAGLASWLSEMLAEDPARRPGQASEALARLNARVGVAYPEEVPASRAARLASGSPPGRGREIDTLWKHLAPSEHPRLVWLCGSAGSGKTRVLRWLAGEGVLRGWEVVEPPPGLREQAGGSGGLLAALRSRAAERPTLVLVDEAERAGGRLARFLDRVAREGKAPPLRVVAAVRPSEAAHPVVRRLLADTGLVPTLRRVDLEPLDEAGVRALAERATGGSSVSETRVRWLLERSEGNPLAAEALLVEGAWERGRRPGSRERGPDVAAGRVELLSAAGRTWLEALAVLDGSVPADLLAGLAGLEPEAAVEAAGEAVAAGLARLAPDGWRVESRSIAQRVLEAMDPGRREHLHRRAARQLVDTGVVFFDPWRLARLWSGAREPERAVDAAVRASQVSGRQGDPAEAADRLAFALRHLGRRDPRRRGLWLRRAECLTAAGLHGAAARALGAALARSSGRAERADVLGRQALSLARAGRAARAREAASEAIALARGGGMRAEEARAMQAMGAALIRSNRDREAIDFLDRAVRAFRAAGDTASEADALQNLATAKSNLHLPEAEADHLLAVKLFGACGQPEKSLKSLIGLAKAKKRAGRLADAAALLEQARSSALEQGNVLLHQIALSRLADVARLEGRLDRALSLGREASDLALHLGDRTEDLVARAQLGEILIACGRPAEAAALLDASLEHSEGVEPEVADYLRMILADALLDGPAGDDRKAAALLETCIEGCRRRRKRRPFLMALAVEMTRRARPGCPDPLDPIGVEFDTVALSGGGPEVEPEIRIRADLARAEWLLLRGNAAGATEPAARAVDAAAEAGMRGKAAQAASLLAEALERLDRSEEASEALDRGRRFLDEAAGAIEDPALRRDYLDRWVFRRLRDRATRPEVRGGDRRLAALYDMIRTLNSETDPEALLDSILQQAIGVVRAERGMILLREPGGDSFSVRAARDLDEDTARDAQRYSRSIVAQAGAGSAVLAHDAGSDERFRDLKSVSLYGIRSLMCVPLRSRGKIIGTVYLDTRREGALFTKEDLRFLEAFADHAALALENAQNRAALEQENRRLQVVAETRVRFDNLVGRSEPMQRVFDLIEKTAASELPVLILGESGTGKELVARAIHFHGPRKRRGFISENCAAIPETLLESELFGAMRGAYTGAEKDRAGLFELAHGGTLFLDEIGDMSPAMQARLLRVLEEGELRRVGGTRTIKVDVRLVAATHRDLQTEVAAGRFREDLLYRLKVLMIHLPALRDRPGDIPLLVASLLERIARERGRPAPRIDAEVLDRFERYPWPGNVRQLENSLQRLALLAGDGRISIPLLESEPDLRQTFLGPDVLAEPIYSLDRTEREQIARALVAAEGNRNRAAKLLGVSRATIYRKIKEYGLS